MCASVVETILVVEDELPLREAIRLRLRQSGHEVLAAASLSEARTLVRNQPRPCAAILDGRLPDGDGIEFASELRGELGLSDLPIVVHTASPRCARDAEDLPEPKAIFAKPVAWTRVAEALERLVTDSRTSGSEPAP